MTLKEYLEYFSIDEIEDDDEFMQKEYCTIENYCEERNYIISEEDMNTIISRGLEESFGSGVMIRTE